MKISSGLLKLIPLALALFLQVSAAAQSIKHKIAEDYYNNLDFTAAAAVYKDILSKHPEDSLAIRGAAFALEQTGNYDQAEPFFQKAAQAPWAKPDDLLRYADLLRKLSKYQLSVEVYAKYLLLMPQHQYLAAYVEDPKLFHKIFRDSARFSLRAADNINTSFSDFGPCLTDSLTFFFSSARPEGKGKNHTYLWNNQSYLNLFSAILNPDTSLRNAALAPSAINSRFHEGTLSFDPVSKTIYITRNNFFGGDAKKDRDGFLRLAIFSASFENGTWGELIPFPYNDIAFNNGHPAISHDGNRIYFVSDRPGGLGGADIWFCDKDGEQWGKPVNLGQPVNTPADEMFPFVHADMLYFASSGHPGLGGLDLFRAEFKDQQVSLIRNLGYPVNTQHDDFSIILIGSGRRGFFSSNRPGGAGDDDIYEVRIAKPTSLRIQGRTLLALDDSPIENTTVLLEQSDETQLMDVLTNSNKKGEYSAEVPYADELVLLAKKDGYVPTALHLSADPFSEFIDDADFRLKKYDFAAEGRVLLSDINQPANGATVKLSNIDSGEIEQVTTGMDGRYFFGLMANSKYRIEASFGDYLPLSASVDTKNATEKTFYNDFNLFKAEKGTVVRLDNIYYDYNKADIRPDAAIELDVLIRILNDNPTMKIELSSHTDSRGSDSYNLDLSKRRALAAVQYMISKGIDKNRLVSKGYGESIPLNHCTNGTKCSDEEFQINRRTEFKILDI